MNDPNTLIITGMHRSGTSLTASILERAGLNLGTNLNPPAPDNRHGFFEDRELVQFHQDLLHARGETLFVTAPLALAPSATEMERAHTLATRFADQNILAWKDPRAVLFLDLWAAVLPGARYLFVYRSPLEVLFSLMRRKNRDMPGLLEALDAWTVYNQSILNFYAAHPNTSVLCHVKALVAQPDTFFRLLADKLGIETNGTAASVDDLYDEGELHSVELTATVLEALAASHPDALRVYAALEQQADLALAITATDRYAFAAGDALPRPLRRAELLRLCATLVPDLTETFYNAAPRSTLQEAQQYVLSLQATLQATRERLRESFEYVQSLENGIIQALLQAAEAKRYSNSLAETLERTRAMRADAETHARSLSEALEQTRGYLKHSEDYARSLEQEIEKMRVAK